MGDIPIPQDPETAADNRAYAVGGTKAADVLNKILAGKRSLMRIH